MFIFFLQTDLPTPFKDIIKIVSCVKVLNHEVNYISLNKEDIIAAISSGEIINMT